MWWTWTNRLRSFALHLWFGYTDEVYAIFTINKQMIKLKCTSVKFYGDSPKEVDDVEMRTNMNQNLQFWQQRLQLFTISNV